MEPPLPSGLPQPLCTRTALPLKCQRRGDACRHSKAIVVATVEGGQKVGLTRFGRGRSDGRANRHRAVEWSTVKYKDGIAVTGTRRWCADLPGSGIRFRGQVEASAHRSGSPATGSSSPAWGVGETHLGGHTPKGAGSRRLDGAAARAQTEPRGRWRVGTARLHRHAAVIGARAPGVTPRHGPLDRDRRGRRAGSSE